MGATGGQNLQDASIWSLKLQIFPEDHVPASPLALAFSASNTCNMDFSITYCIGIGTSGVQNLPDATIWSLK